MSANSADSSSPLPGSGMGLPPIGLGTLLRAIKRYSLLFVLFVMIAGGAGTAVYMFLPLPKMNSSVVFHIAASPPAVLNTPADARIDFGLYRQQQTTIVKSRQVITGALSDPTVANLPMLDRVLIGDPVQYVTNSLRIDFQLGPEYMRVGIDGNDGEQLNTVLKAVSASYMRQSVEKDKNRRLAKLDQLKKLQDRYSEDLRLNRSRIRKVMESLGSGDPFAIQIRERFLESTLGMTQSQLAGVLSSMREKSVEAALTEKSLAETTVDLPDPVLSDLVKLEPAYAQLQKQQTQIAMELENLAINLQPGVKTPRMLQLETERDRLRSELTQLPAKLKPVIAQRYKESAVRSDRQKLDSYKEKMTLLSNMQKVLVKDIDEMIAKRKENSVNSFELETLKQDVVQTEIMSDRIANEIEQMKPEVDAPTRVTLWEEPVAAPGAEGNKRVKYTGMTAGGILLVGLILIQWLDLRNRRVHHLDELSNGLGLTILGTVPRVEKHSRTSTDPNVYRVLTESVNTTRTMLLGGKIANSFTAQPHEAGLGRTILITSATSSEGKTSLTTHLSVSLASAGRRVLLIDSDMRRPAAHLVMGLELKNGLSNYLLGECDARDVIKPTRIAGLDIITAGVFNEVAVAGFNSITWANLLQMAQAEYDFVMIDSPPILPVADSLTIAKNVQAVLLTVMQDHSRYMAVHAACNRLSLIGANVIGVVMSGSTTAQSGYYYDGYYNGYKTKQVDAAETGERPSTKL
jgi:polysaccharide biosynthesis transport protein